MTKTPKQNPPARKQKKQKRERERQADVEHSKPVKQTYRDNRQWFQYTCRVEKRFLDTKWVLSALKTKVRGASFFMAI